MWVQIAHMPPEEWAYNVDLIGFSWASPKCVKLIDCNWIKTVVAVRPPSPDLAWGMFPGALRRICWGGV